MAGKKWRMTNWHRARRKLAKTGGASVEALKKSIRSAGDMTLSLARANAPVDPSPDPKRRLLKGTNRKTGHVRDALRKVERDKGLRVRIGVIGKRARDKGWNIVFIERDPGNQSYSPFLIPAKRAAEQRFSTDIVNNTRSALIDVAGSAEPDR